MKGKILKRIIFAIILTISLIFLSTGCLLKMLPTQVNPTPTPRPPSLDLSVKDNLDKYNSYIKIQKPEWKFDISPYTFKQYFYGNWGTSFLWKNQYAMNLATEKTGIKIDRYLASGNDDDYLNTIIAADDLPDTLMVDWNKPTVSRLINNGLVFSITDLINEYCPYFTKMLDKSLIKYHSVNGKLWYLPNYYTTKENVNLGRPGIPIRPWFVRKDIYDELGKPNLKTPEDIINVLKMVKSKYPYLGLLGLEKFDVNSEGFKGSKSMDYLIYSFSPYIETERINNTKQLYEYPMRNKGFKEAFRFVNRLYREGLLDSQLLIYKQEQYEEKVYHTDYFMPSMYVDDMYSKFNPKIEASLGKNKTYECMDALKVNGKNPRYPNSRLMGWQALLISKKATKPERIIRFAEYAWSDEGQLDALFGKLGVTYDIIDGLPYLRKNIEDLRRDDKTSFDEKYGFGNSTLLWRSGALWDKADHITFKKQQPAQYNAITMLAKYNFDAFPLGIENVEPEGTSSEGIINSKIKDMWSRAIPDLILAKSPSDFDTVYKDFLVQIDKLGAQKVEKVMYQRHLIDMKKKSEN